MPARFDRLGISFQYPDNWTLDDSDALLGRRSVTVYSPSGAFWSVAIHSSSVDPAELAASVVEAMRKEYTELEVAEARETVEDQDLLGYDLAFFYLDLTNTAMIRSLQIASSTYLFFCQAEDRDLEQIGLVFQAMTASLLRELRASGQE